MLGTVQPPATGSRSISDQGSDMAHSALNEAKHCGCSVGYSPGP